MHPPDYHRPGFEAFMTRGRPLDTQIVSREPGTGRVSDYTMRSTEMQWLVWKAAINVERASLQRRIEGTAR